MLGCLFLLCVLVVFLFSVLRLRALLISFLHGLFVCLFLDYFLGVLVVFLFSVHLVCFLSRDMRGSLYPLSQTLLVLARSLSHDMRGSLYPLSSEFCVIDSTMSMMAMRWTMPMMAMMAMFSLFAKQAPAATAIMMQTLIFYVK